MTTQTEKKEKSLAELIVIVALVGVMMAVFIKYFIENEDQFIKAGFSVVSQTFSTKVTAVHAQWMMDRQPNIVYLASLNRKNKQAVPVNKAGWIDVKQALLPCEAIWLLVIEEPMHSMHFSVSAIEIHSSEPLEQGKTKRGENQEQHRIENTVCRYVLLNGSYFQYNRAKGKVSNVIEQSRY